MKKYIILYRSVALALMSTFVLTSCNDWLNLLPKNEQVTDKYWKTKEDVEAVVTSGYYYMRTEVPQMLLFGELRASTLYNIGTSDATKIQDFDILPSNTNVKYSVLYQIINMANSVIHYADDAQANDATYYDALKNSHICEALFQRAYAYSILVKNYKEVPLVTQASVTDKAEFRLPKSSESAIIAQIKSDIETALATGAAKGNYEEEWQTKGRVTKWALYALMADICLWNHEYEECVKYANMILEAKDALRPVFISDMSNWFDIFYPGNSNESIFELNWDYATYGETNNFTTRFAFDNAIGTAAGSYNISEATKEKLMAETAEVLANNPELTQDGRIGRMYLASFITGSASTTYNDKATYFSIWKYRGSDIVNPSTFRNNSNWDANFILYRVADIKLMKAEALVMMGQSYWRDAIKEINDIRLRAGLKSLVVLNTDDDQTLNPSESDEIAAYDQFTLLNEILNQREMEFLGEAKRWYDVLRFARYDSNFAPEGTVEDESEEEYESYKTQGFGADEFKYKESAIDMIIAANTTTNGNQIRSILQNSWAWYIPLPQSDVETNKNLIQNPYYN
jgi:starch-binding outer membrane protein, SusD/RagB family